MDIVQQGWLRYFSVVFDCIVYVTTLQLTVTRLGVEKLIMTDLGSSCKKKKTPLPEHVLRRFPPYRRAELQRVSSDSESSGPDEPLHIPQSASVEFSVHNNQPGLHVKTRNTMIWTPIASRTRARMKGTR